jgi:hypothetical protein
VTSILFTVQLVDRPAQTVRNAVEPLASGRLVPHIFRGKGMTPEAFDIQRPQGGARVSACFWFHQHETRSKLALRGNGPDPDPWVYTKVYSLQFGRGKEGSRLRGAFFDNLRGENITIVGSAWVKSDSAIGRKVYDKVKDGFGHWMTVRIVSEERNEIIGD